MRKRLIDAHCHLFGAEDLPMEGVLVNVLMRSFPDIATEILRPLIKLLTDIMEWIGPNAESESDRLKELLEDYQEDIPGLKSAIGARYETYEDGEPTPEELEIALENALKKLSESDLEEDRQFLKQARRELALPSEAEGDEQIYPPMAKGFLLGKAGDYIKSGLKLIRALLRYRYKNTRKHIKMYLSEADTSYFSSPLLVDYGNWIGNAPETSMPEQVELMVLNNRLHQGRLLPFVPFDPWRAITNELFDPMNLVMNSIEKDGFVGVKLYPPNGFLPIGNEFISNDKFHNNGYKLPHEFGKKLDNVLRQLYRYCQKNCVPITAHCSQSMGPTGEDEEKAHPDNWGKVANEFKSLKINLGHCGGKYWLKEALEVIKQHKNVYADFSYAEFVGDDDDQQKAIKTIRDQIEHVKDKLMFGTDWIMLIMEPEYEEYLDNFENIYDQIVDNEEDKHKFFYQNAVNFFGLHNTEASKRLEDFYMRYGISSPLKTDFAS